MDAFIIGAGGSGFLHALALRSAGVRIAAVYDPDHERAEWLAGLTSARPARDLEAAADIVAVCSPPAFHVAQCEAVARPGRITFVEKPIAIAHDELARLAALPGVVPILQWRAGRSAHALRAAFAAGVFGPAPRIACDFRLWRDGEYWAAKSVDAWPCGALLSIGIHAVDLILWSVGRPVIHATCTDTRIAGRLALEFDDGTTADVRITLDAPDHDDFRLLVRGERASADLRASEEDPTASPLRWHGVPSLPSGGSSGATGSPLLVPYLHAALAGARIGVRDVQAAHVLLMPASRDRSSREAARCNPPRDAPASRPRSRCD